jgi:hypothetical protein
MTATPSFGLAFKIRKKNIFDPSTYSHERVLLRTQPYGTCFGPMIISTTNGIFAGDSFLSGATFAFAPLEKPLSKLNAGASVSRSIWSRLVTSIGESGIV